MTGSRVSWSEAGHGEEPGGRVEAAGKGGDSAIGSRVQLSRTCQLGGATNGSGEAKDAGVL